MPFQALSKNSVGNTDAKKHILSFVNHTLPMFIMSRVSREARELVKETLEEIPTEFLDAPNAKNFWLKTKDETLKLHMRSPTFLKKIAGHIDPKTKDKFICELILALSLEIKEANQSLSYEMASGMPPLIDSGVRFGHLPSKFFEPAHRTGLLPGTGIAYRIMQTTKHKVKALSLGVSCDEFEGLSDIHIEALSLGLPRKDIMNIDEKILWKQLGFWKDNIEEYAWLLKGVRDEVNERRTNISPSA